ncbi:MAG: sulfate transporter CysZ [Gammaproteobacteria bacterium]|nr:sulfate transporter CysZ [Gammaproteobacteria bacterium]
MGALLLGPRSLLAGLRLILKPGVRLYLLIPLSINVMLFAGAFIYGAGVVRDIIDGLRAQWAWADWIAWILWPLFLIVALAIVFFCFSILANLIAAPFNEFLAKEVERSLTGRVRADRDNVSLLAEIAAALRAEAAKFVYFAVRALPLLLLFVVPLVNAVAPLVWFLFGAWMLAVEYLEYPMGNSGMLFPEVRARLASHRAVALGFGAAVLLFTLIPVLNLIVMPVAVAAATKIWVEEIRPRESLTG